VVDEIGIGAGDGVGSDTLAMKSFQALDTMIEFKEEIILRNGVYSYFSETVNTMII